MIEIGLESSSVLDQWKNEHLSIKRYDSWSIFPEQIKVNLKVNSVVNHFSPPEDFIINRDILLQ